jgi:protoporphyrin/coproporphyrin ferrochelatase
MSLPHQAVLLIAFGGPNAPDEIRPFLARVTKGISIPSDRLEEVAHHYEAVGGKSPLNEITFQQAHALQRLLKQKGIPLPVYVGMRNAQPFFVEALKQMADDGIRRALGFILSSHKTEASWDRYQKNIADARAELDSRAPEFDYCEGWHDHPLFIRTWAELIEAGLKKIPVAKREATPLVFTAHSLPVGMAARSLYGEEVQATARLVAQRLNHPRWSIAYQSRSGKPTDSWLEPDIKDVIRKLEAERIEDIVVAPIGFVCDHVEVLYDLDIEAKKIAHDLGVNLVRSDCPNDHPTFIEMMADIVIKNLE